MSQTVQVLNTVQQQPSTQPIGNAHAVVPSVGGSPFQLICFLALSLVSTIGNGSGAMNVNGMSLFFSLPGPALSKYSLPQAAGLLRKNSALSSASPA